MGALNNGLFQLPWVRGEEAPKVAKNTILRDRVNDEQAKLAKQGPLMVRNPKKNAKGA